MPDRYGDVDGSDDVLWDAEQRRLQAIERCDLCNVDGVRADLTRCDHKNYAAIAARGLAKVREVLEGRGKQ